MYLLAQDLKYIRLNVLTYFEAKNFCFYLYLETFDKLY